ncbi:Glucokinase [Phytophthora citrophthora]|uniref:Glucokinase n=1 Tax=Phytophthora citrophthora TaxID=4793 RepID=A0AAD9LTM8_9STRA|nr:Glucokinase [Phytophthora citrophthora]
MLRAQKNYEPGGRKPQDVVDLAAAVLHKLLVKQHLSLGELEVVGWGWAVLASWKTTALFMQVTVCNDADAAVLAEQWVGSAKDGIKTFIMLSMRPSCDVEFGLVADVTIEMDLLGREWVSALWLTGSWLEAGIILWKGDISLLSAMGDYVVALKGGALKPTVQAERLLLGPRNPCKQGEYQDWPHVVEDRGQPITSLERYFASALKFSFRSQAAVVHKQLLIMTAAVMFAGVDIGGTGVKVGVVTSEGVVVARGQENYHPDKHEPQNVVDLATRLGLGDLEAVGVGCPGVLEAGGIIRAAANFPSWMDVPLQQLFSETLGRPVTVCNDADAAILAEQWVGTAKGGIQDFIMLSVGFGVVANGELVRGGSNAIEGGHMIVERNGRPCGCSQRGCLEAYSSAGALMSQAQEHLRAGRDSSLAKYSEADINAEFVFKHAAEGDELCKHLIEEAADYLGFACVTFCRMLDPEKMVVHVFLMKIIVLSGGIAEAGETYIEQIRRAYAKHTWTKFPNPVRIEKASAGYDSGIIGAVAVCRNQRKGQ